MRKLKKGDIIAIKAMRFNYEILEIESNKNEYDLTTILTVKCLETLLDYRFSIPTEKIPVFITKLEG